MTRHIAKYGTTKPRPKIMPKILKTNAKTGGGSTPGQKGSSSLSRYAVLEHAVGKDHKEWSEQKSGVSSKYEPQYYYGAEFQNRLLKIQDKCATPKPSGHVEADAPT